MTDGGPGGSAGKLWNLHVWGDEDPAGINIGLVCAAAVIILIVAFVISFIQLKMTAKNGQV